MSNEIVAEIWDSKYAVKATCSKIFIYENPYEIVTGQVSFIHGLIEYLNPKPLDMLKPKWIIDYRDIIRFTVEENSVAIKCFRIGDISIELLSKFNVELLTFLLESFISGAKCNSVIDLVDEKLINNLPLQVVDENFVVVLRGNCLSIYEPSNYFYACRMSDGSFYGYYDALISKMPVFGERARAVDVPYDSIKRVAPKNESSLIIQTIDSKFIELKFTSKNYLKFLHRLLTRILTKYRKTTPEEYERIVREKRKISIKAAVGLTSTIISYLILSDLLNAPNWLLLIISIFIGSLVAYFYNPRD